MLVLNARDSLQGYVLNRAASGPITNAMAARNASPAVQAQIDGTGRIMGYSTSWYPTGNAGGTAEIVSSASTFRTIEGARKAFDLGVKAIGRSYSTINITPPIGNRSHVFTIQMDGPVNALTLLLVAWQYDHVLATVVATGDVDTFNADVAIKLARRQQRMISSLLPDTK
jgi:hypothetical protein